MLTSLKAGVRRQGIPVAVSFPGIVFPNKSSPPKMGLYHPLYCVREMRAKLITDTEERLGVGLRPVKNVN